MPAPRDYQLFKEWLLAETAIVYSIALLFMRRSRGALPAAPRLWLGIVIAATAWWLLAALFALPIVAPANIVGIAVASYLSLRWAYRS